MTCKERVLTFTTNYTKQLLLSSQHASELQHTFLNIHMMANQCWSLFLQKRRVYWPQRKLVRVEPVWGWTGQRDFSLTTNGGDKTC